MARQMETARKQTFRFSAPAAMSVLLVGDFTHWQRKGIPMQKGKDGIWFIVDNEWRDDPEGTLRVPNPYGSQNMVRQVV